MPLHHPNPHAYRDDQVEVDFGPALRMRVRDECLNDETKDRVRFGSLSAGFDLDRRTAAWLVGRIWLAGRDGFATGEERFEVGHESWQLEVEPVEDGLRIAMLTQYASPEMRLERTLDFEECERALVELLLVVGTPR